MKHLNTTELQALIDEHLEFLESNRQKGTVINFQNLSITEFQFKSLNFDGVILGEAVFKNCEFVDVDFGNAPFDRSIIQDCNFENCSFYYGTFHGSKILGSTFKQCNFTKVESFEAEIRGCEFTKCNFKFFDFSDGMIFNTKFITIEAKDQANFYKNQEENVVWQ